MAARYSNEPHAGTQVTLISMLWGSASSESCWLWAPFRYPERCCCLLGTSRLIARVAQCLSFITLIVMRLAASVHIQLQFAETSANSHARNGSTEVNMFRNRVSEKMCSYVPNKHNWSSLATTADWINALCTRIFFSRGTTAPSWPAAPHYGGFTATIRHTTLSRTPLDEWSARHRDLYLTTQQTAIHFPVGFEPKVTAGKRPQTHALDRAATRIIIIIIIIIITYLLTYLLQFSFHSVAVVLTPVQTKQIRINVHKGNNTKTQYKQYKTQ